MPLKKLKNDDSDHLPTNGIGGGGSGDLQTRAAFTSAIVAALKDLEAKKAPESRDLGQRAYQKLQYDLPLVSPEELTGLANTLRASLQLKSGQPLLPITSKLLENVVAGARAPLPVGAPLISLPLQSLSSATSAQNDQPGAAASAAMGGVSEPMRQSGAGEGVAPLKSNGAPNSVGATAAHQTSVMPTADAAKESLPSSLVDAEVLNPDHQSLCSAFRSLCAVIFVPLVSHALAVSEHDTWGMLYGIGLGQPDGEGEDPESKSTGRQEGGGSAEPQLGHRDLQVGQVQSLGNSQPEREQQEQQREQLAHSSSAAPVGFSNARKDPGCGSGAAVDAVPVPAPMGPTSDLIAQEQQPERPQSRTVYDEPEAAEEDGDDFVFEDLEAPCGSRHGGSDSAPATAATPASSLVWDLRQLAISPPPYSWPALRSRLLRLSGHVSYALLDEPDLWRDGQLLQGVFQLLRALGAHRHSQELQPVLHAYVGLVTDRIAAEPADLACLDNLWDAVGLQCIASLPQVGRQRAAAGAMRGGQGLLLAEATTCLSLVATLAGQLTGATAKLRLWQQVHKHMLPLLGRCLGELSRMVGPGQAARAAKHGTPQRQQQQGPQPKSPGPEEVAAIVLVCQVLDFYVQQRPGNADLAAALQSAGVLASLSVLFAAAADLPGAEPLRSAALCCAASSRELHAWMLAVPGLSKALAGPPFQENGAHEEHGAVWELLGSGGSSPLVLSVLAGGAAPEKAVRVHALLQLLSKAAACRGGRDSGCGGLWGPSVERAMRELFDALRQEQVGGAVVLASGRTRAATAASAVALSAPVEAGACQEQDAAGLPSQAAAAMVMDEDGDEDGDDDKLHLLQPDALQRRRARQLHPACWRILKQLLTTSGESSGKTD